jgi:hypothetical protein
MGFNPVKPPSPASRNSSVGIPLKDSIYSFPHVLSGLMPESFFPDLLFNPESPWP